MSRFIPFDEQKANELSNTLSQTIFKNVDQFVLYYNSGLINKNFDEVKNLSKTVLETFKDVRERKGKLIFISEEEVTLNEILQALNPWTAIVKATREVNDALSEKFIQEYDTLLLDENGVLNVIRVNEDGAEELEPLTNDKLFSKNDDVELFLNLSTIQDDTVEGTKFKVSDLKNIDTSFISRVKEQIPNLN